MKMRVDFAPLDGITKGGVPAGVAPALRRRGPVFHPLFLSPTDQHVVTPRDRRELDPEANRGIPSVPQIMTRKAPDFLWAAELMEDPGYREVNLNLGCPSGTVTAKGKGLRLPGPSGGAAAVFGRGVCLRSDAGVHQDPAGLPGSQRSFTSCWNSTTGIPSPASPSIPGCGRSL